MLHDEFLYDKAWILTRAIHIIRLGKLPHMCYLLLHWVLSSFVDILWEVCHALKIKITYTPPTYSCCSYTKSTKKHAFHLDPPKNVPLLHWGWTQKHVRFFIHQINAPSSCWYISQSFVVEKRHGAMQKLIIKKESWEKNRQVSKILKTMGT
jgi:hypothetical protein